MCVFARAGPEIGRKSVKFRDLASQKCQVSPLKIGPFFVTTRVPPATFCENGVFQVSSPCYDVSPNSGAVFARSGTPGCGQGTFTVLQEENPLPRARGRGRAGAGACACARVCACARAGTRFRADVRSDVANVDAEFLYQSLHTSEFCGYPPIPARNPVASGATGSQIWGQLQNPDFCQMSDLASRMLMPCFFTRVCTPPNSAGTHPSRRESGRRNRSRVRGDHDRHAGPPRLV